MGCTNSPDVQITDFESCVAAGNPVMESYPEQCNDGNNTYTKDYTGEFCGGIAALGCPAGFTCTLESDIPDAGGTCVKN